MSSKTVWIIHCRLIWRVLADNNWTSCCWRCFATHPRGFFSSLIFSYLTPAWPRWLRLFRHCGLIHFSSSHMAKTIGCKVQNIDVCLFPHRNVMQEGHKRCAGMCLELKTHPSIFVLSSNSFSSWALARISWEILSCLTWHINPQWAVVPPQKYPLGQG